MTVHHILPYVSSDLPASDGGPDKPRVLWNNLMQTGSPTSITPSAEPDPANYPYQNAYDGRSYTYWKVPSGVQYLTVVFPVGKAVNAYALYLTGDETIAHLGGTATFQYSTDSGATWNNFLPTEAPIDSTPIYRQTVTVTATRWRWKFDCPSAHYVSVLSFGTDFQFERGCWVGFNPPQLARSTVLTNNVSQGGNFLGRSIIRNGMSTMFNMEWLTPGFVRTYWLPFIVWAERKPWFLLWDKTGYPADAAFCWTDGDIGKPENSHSNFMSAKMKIMGRTD